MMNIFKKLFAHRSPNFLGRNISLALIITSLICANLLLFSFINLSRTQKDFTSINAIKSLSNQVADTISSRIEQKVSNIKYLASNHLVSAKELESIVDTYGQYIWIGVTDENGKVISATYNDLVGQTLTPQALQNGSLTTTVSDILPLAINISKLQKSIQKPKLTITTPMRSSDNKFMGVISAVVDLQFLNGISNFSKYTMDTTQIFVLNHDLKSIIGDPISDQTYSQAIKDSSLRYSGAYIYDWKEGKYYTAFTNIFSPNFSGLDWSVILRQQYKPSQVLTDNPNAFQVVMIVSLFFIIGSVLIGLFISRPYVRLSLIARDIIHGKMPIKSFEGYKNEQVQIIYAGLKKLSLKDKEIETLNLKIKSIKKDKRNLSQKINEFEELNNHMIGRELKMVKLKKEIELLKESIKK